MEAGKETRAEAVEGPKRCRREEEHDWEGKEKKMKKVHDHGDGRSFFDCNICLDMEREPVLTYCGHLFCWACFYKLRYVDSIVKTKECPVCRGEVSDFSIIPIYGNEDSIGESVSESGTSMNIPPRPKGEQAERPRQSACQNSPPIYI